VDLRRLRALTIVAPLAFLLAVELVSLVVLRTSVSNPIPRLLLIFALLAAGAIAFSFWVFGTIERQQRSLLQTSDRVHALNAELEQRVAELAAAHEAVMRRNRELATVNTAIRSISSALDLSHVLQSIADAARELVQSRYAALGVADERGRIVQFITSGITPDERAAIGPLPQGHGLLGALIQEGKPLRIPDIARDPRSHGFPPHHPPMTSLLGVPILFQDRAVGDLYLTDKIGAEEFSEEDQNLLLLLAGHAAVAIENARLYDEVRTARDRLQLWTEELEAKVAERTREIQRHSQELTTRVLQAQEEERKRIARELHDETAQSLSTLLITLDLLESVVPQDNDGLRAGFERIRGLAKRTLDETRALSHALRPTILDDFGLVAALRWFADEFRQTFGTPVEVRIDTAPDARLAPELELGLFRIAQEALTNSGKYAQADSTRLQLSFPDGTAQLVVKDNGRGFDPDRLAGPTRQGGLGLYGMRERAALLGATLEIDSAPGQGTRVRVRAPLTREERGSRP
jgi:signal transduction histidine kinase